MTAYFDYNATSPLEPLVLKAINEAYNKSWANPSSNYQLGQDAKATINKARIHVAKMLDVSEPDDIIFTSGGTESNNIIIYSIVHNMNEENKGINKNTYTNFLNHSPYSHDIDRNGFVAQIDIPNIITSDIEHDSISLLLNFLEKQGQISVTRLPICPTTGTVCVKDVLAAIKPNTKLITIMLANNETGVIQPVGEICSAVTEYLSQASTTVADVNNNNVGCLNELPCRSDIIIHTDMAQAIGKIPVSVEFLGVDACTLVGHKFYGPRIGGLYFKNASRINPHPKSMMEKPSNLRPLFYGGGQERGLRPGTENTADICGLGKACQLVQENLSTYTSNMLSTTTYLIEKLSTTFTPDIINFNNLTFLKPTSPEGDNIKCGKLFEQQATLHNFILLPNTLNISFKPMGWDGRKILANCKLLMASTGAACHTHAHSGSSALIKSGISPALAANAIRLSVGRYTSHEDVDKVVQDLKDVIDRLNNNEI